MGNEVRCIAEEVPFEIPDSWEWVRLGNIGITNIGLTYKPSDVCETGTPVLRSNNIQRGEIDYKQVIKVSCNVSNRAMLNKGDILICARNGSRALVGKAAIVDKEGMAFGAFMAKFSSICNPYILIFINSPLFRHKLEGVKTETINQITQNNLRQTLCPLPPLNEQKRIVAKIEELLPLVKEYDVAYEKIEKLNNNFPEQLKKSILQEAVQGKLVPQNPKDEPASILIERIREEKQKLIKEKKIKKDKNESYIFRRDNSHYEKIGNEERCIDDEIPFEIPDSWEWCRLGSILTKLTDGTHSTPKYTQVGIPFLSVKDMSCGTIDFSDTKFISELEHNELYKRCNPEYGDLLLTKVGTTGIPVIVETEKEFSLFVSVALLKFNQNFIYNKFLKYLILSPLVQNQARENTKGVGNKNWVMRDISNTLIVIPPYNEQLHIVEKIEQLLPKIKTLQK